MIDRVPKKDLDDVSALPLPKHVREKRTTHSSLPHPSIEYHTQPKVYCKVNDKHCSLLD